MPPRSRFASKGAFDALAPADDEEDITSDIEASTAGDTADERATTSAAAAATSPPGTPGKLTRGAKRRAAKERKAGAASPTPSPAPSTPAAAAAATDSAAPNSSANGNGEPDLDVMTTRSGRTHPRASTEPRDEVPAVKQEQQEDTVVPDGVAAAMPSASTSSPSTRGTGKQPVVEITRPPGGSTRQPFASTTSDRPGSNIGLKPPQQTFLAGKKKSQATKADSSKAISGGDSDSKAFWKKVYERTIFTFLMIGGFIFLLCLGHPYVIILVLIIQVLVYREVTALFNIPGRPSVTGSQKRGATSNASSRAGSAAQSEDEDDEGVQEGRRREELWSKTLSWYFFAVSNYFLYGESLIYYFKHIVFVDAYFIPFARHHRFLSFMLYIFGFMAFVSGLKRENLKHQFGLFCWVHMSLLLIVYSSHFMVNNILEGLIWFFVPASLVICNDVFAYICGMLFGRTPLISLSPKKTVEGFVGALVVTEIFAFAWATIFQRFNYLICPAVSLGMNAFTPNGCEPNHVFLWQAWPLPPAIGQALTHLVSPVWEALTGHGLVVDKLPYTAFQLHALVMAAFASLVAPFGGFFASGFKRAFNIKDFGDSIPGHGGLTDRFDCQFIMGLFSYVYYSSLIREHHVTIGSVLQTVVTHLTVEDQLELYRELTRYLHGQGVKV